ncbi:hypothetical protein [Klebsiella quasipneumoniae]|uniref:hypothetical protein n=1 Tax=Klebsiella quasipneumoniae TaxID=1463165 RepID=UPI001D0D9BEE|nr:hypothetical protein [Klebsiella quasipneumoniae]
MTSKLTREQLHERARENVKALKMASRQTAFESARKEILADLQLAELALAAMDSEPVAWTWHYREQWHVTNDKCRAEFVAKDGDVAVLPLYRHAQPVLEIESEPVFTLEVARADYKGQKLGNHFGFITLDAARELKEGNYQLYTVQPAPVVPEEMTPEMMRAVQLNSELGAYAASNLSGAYDLFAEFWKVACRAAMLQAGNCRENANSSTNNCRKIPETSTNRSREHFISLCNEFWNWSEMDEVCAEDRGYELRMEWDGKVFKHPVTQALWRMYQAAPQEVNHG